MKESKTGRREEEKNKKRKRKKKKKRKREEPRRKVWIYGMDFYDFFFLYGSLVLFFEKVWIPFCLDLYGTWYKFVWKLALIVWKF